MRVLDYGILDLNRPDIEITLDLLYIENQVKLYSAKTELGEPMALDTRPDVYWDQNTFVPIRVAESAGLPLDGTNGLEYHRITFDEAGVKVIPVQTQPTTIYQVLDKINKSYGVQLTERDILDAPIIPGQDPNLVANARSWVWQGTSRMAQRNTILTKLHLDCFKEYVA